MGETTVVTYWLSLSLAVVVYIATKLTSKSASLDFVPAIGPSGKFTSYIGTIRYLFNGKVMIQNGYDKHYGSMFRVPLINCWNVIVSGPQLIEDVRRAKEEELSFYAANAEFFQEKYTMGSDLGKNSYHVKVVQLGLTRNIGARFPDIIDEVDSAFQDVISLHGEEWKSIPALQAVTEIICRISNRYFVGLPLCRDKDFQQLNIQYTVDAFIAATLIGLSPKLLRPIVGPMLSPFNRAMRRALKHLGPVITQRLSDEAELGKDRSDRPNDLITWLIDEAPDDERTPWHITQRILFINMAAIHTSSSSFTHVLYHIAASPEYVEPLRDEVKNLIAKEGFTKDALDKMRKVDSFVRESQRFNGFATVIMNRKVLKPGGFTFSNGITLPQGTFVSIAENATHHNSRYYTKPNTFDGSRFVSDSGEAKDQLVNTDLNYIVFGHGRHSCPGRFFAANELKAMLAYLVLNYDVKLDHGATMRPPNQWVGTNCVPNRGARVVFRRRS